MRTWVLGLALLAALVALGGCYRVTGPCGHGPCESFAGCAPQQARGTGPCRAVIGYFWDGHDCAPQSGCGCEGPDCDLGYATAEECLRDRASCRQPGTRCPAQEARVSGACGVVQGVFWDGARCVERRGCACDGADCARRFASVTACHQAYAACGGGMCGPQDARGVGDCPHSVGVFWNGRDCEFQWGCGCVGRDCGTPFHTIEACRQQHVRCP